MPPSLRFLRFLVRRLEGVPVLLVLGVRTGDPGADSPVLAQVAAAPSTSVVRPAALSEDAVGELIHDRLGHPDADFVAGCHAATGGTPFLVRELVDALAADGVAPRARVGTADARLRPGDGRARDAPAPGDAARGRGAASPTPSRSSAATRACIWSRAWRSWARTRRSPPPMRSSPPTSCGPATRWSSSTRSCAPRSTGSCPRPLGPPVTLARHTCCRRSPPTSTPSPRT